MWKRVQVNFSVYDPRGWYDGWECHPVLDTTLPLHDQAQAAIEYEIEKHNKRFNADLRVGALLSVFYEDKGFWHAEYAKAEGERLQWSLHGGARETADEYARRKPETLVGGAWSRRSRGD